MFGIPLDSDENGSDKATNIFCDNINIVNNCTNVEPILNKITVHVHIILTDGLLHRIQYL